MFTTGGYLRTDSMEFGGFPVATMTFDVSQTLFALGFILDGFGFGNFIFAHKTHTCARQELFFFF